MKRKDLIEDAKSLKQPSQETLMEFTDKKEMMIRDLNDLLFSSPGFESIVAKDLHDMLRDNHQNQFKFMESVYSAYNADVFVNTVLWVFSTYRSHGFNLEYWDRLFPAVLKIYEKHLTGQAFAELAPFYRWLNAKKHVFIQLSNEAGQPEDRSFLNR